MSAKRKKKSPLCSRKRKVYKAKKRSYQVVGKKSPQRRYCRRRSGQVASKSTPARLAGVKPRH